MRLRQYKNEVLYDSSTNIVSKETERRIQNLMHRGSQVLTAAEIEL